MSKTLKLLALVAQKGGTGKSTVASNLAVAAQADGRKTFVADGDPQGSLVDWARARGAAAPHVAPVKARALYVTRNAVERLGMDLMVIDTRGSSEEDAAAAAGIADLTLIVTRPTAVDLRALARTVATLKSLGRPVAFVLNQAPSQRVGVEPVIVGEAITLLVGYGLALAPVGLRSRLIYQTAFAAGRGVMEQDPSGPAAREIGVLWTYVKGRLGG